MSLLHKAGLILDHHARGLMAKCQLDTACITVRHNTAAEPEDPNVQDDYPAAEIQSVEYQAFVHFVAVRSSLRQWMQVQAGDAIIGLLPEHAAEIAAFKGVTFVLPDGKTYQQSETGGDLQALWDSHIGGNAILVAFLLRVVP